MPTDIPQSRRELIGQRLAAGSRVAVTELASEFSVSDDAIRRDLRALAAAGECRRVYGGALPVSPAGGAMSDRMARDRHRKRQLAEAVVGLIADGECLFLDNSSTNLALAEILPASSNLTVISNSAAIVAALADRNDIRLIAIGGVVDPNLGACTGPEALAQVQHIHFDRLLLGACAVSCSHGVCVFDPTDMAFKQQLLASANYVVVLATSDKLETTAPFRVASLKAIDTVVVESDAEGAICSNLAAAGPDIVRAAGTSSQPPISAKTG